MPTGPSSRTFDRRPGYRPADRREPAKPSEPPLIPFIDIIFQILIFFLLTMKFRQQEGHLLSMLPNTHGPDLSVHPLLPEEVRIYVCADMNQRLDQHIGYKERHQDLIRDQKLAGMPVGDVCRIWMELRLAEHALLHRTDRYPPKWGSNRETYERFAGEAGVLYDEIEKRPGRIGPAMVVLDLDGLVPFEHAMGLLNALTKRRITAVEWAANPRFTRYYGR